MARLGENAHPGGGAIKSGGNPSMVCSRTCSSASNLGTDAKLSDLIRCVRADEEHHSETNHNYADNL